MKYCIDIFGNVIELTQAEYRILIDMLGDEECGCTFKIEKTE